MAAKPEHYLQMIVICVYKWGLCGKKGSRQMELCWFGTGCSALPMSTPTHPKKKQKKLGVQHKKCVWYGEATISISNIFFFALLYLFTFSSFFIFNLSFMIFFYSHDSFPSIFLCDFSLHLHSHSISTLSFSTLFSLSSLLPPPPTHSISRLLSFIVSLFFLYCNFLLTFFFSVYPPPSLSSALSFF